MISPVVPVTNPPTRVRPVVRQQRQDIDDKPFIVIWEVTRACQLACAHCRASAIPRRDPRELTTDEGRALLDTIASFPKPHPVVVLTGGDPFERDDLEDLVAHGSRLGLSVALSPSVTPNLTASRLASLRAAGAKAVSLSLDGARPEAHDAFRGFEGTHAATLEAAALVRDSGFRLPVNSTVTADTVTELPELLAQVLDLGAALWSVFFLVPTGRGDALRSLTADEVEQVLHWLVDVSRFIAVKTTEAPHYRRVVIQRAAGAAPFDGDLHAALTARTAEVLAGREVRERPARPPIDVNSGRGFVFIDHRGLVHPSGFLPFVAGDVHDTSLVDIYRTDDTMRRLRRPTTFGGHCGVCEFAEVCGGSRSRAFALTGDPFAADPSCVLNADALAVASGAGAVPPTA